LGENSEFFSSFPWGGWFLREKGVCSVSMQGLGKIGKKKVAKNCQKLAEIRKNS
jgi:hypothetical protein